MKSQQQSLMHAIQQLLGEHGEGLSEYELIKRLDSDYPHLYPKPDLSNPLLLFQHHFYLRHCLYCLQQQYLEQQQGYLAIGLSHIQLLPIQADSQTQQLGQHDALAEYYLDINNLAAETEHSVEALIDGFWRQLNVQHERPQALKVLGLNGDESAAEQKQIYRALRQQHHPDKGGDAETFNAIQQAWQCVSSART